MFEHETMTFSSNYGGVKLTFKTKEKKKLSQSEFFRWSRESLKTGYTSTNRDDFSSHWDFSNTTRNFFNTSGTGQA